MVTIASHPLFGARVGGRLSLDFVNTVRARLPRTQGSARQDFQDVISGERLTDAATLVDWATWVGRLTRAEATGLLEHVRRHPREAAALLGRATRLREAIYRLGKASLEHWLAPAEDLALLNREWQRARAAQQLVPPEHRGPRSVRAAYRVEHAPPDAPADAILWPIVLDAVGLLTSDDVQRLGQCPAAGCGWLFVDTSRSRRRQWCDMAVCGNADKVRRYRDRQRAQLARAARG